MSHQTSTLKALEVAQHELQLARAELDRRRALEAPRPSAWTLASVARLTLGILVLACLLSAGLGLFVYLRPEAGAEFIAWALQGLCDFVSGRRC